jgi:2-polyprenyl-3-methyl-5-hydroxy-6-metoxy-1,4-benzoquinol methylase
LRDQYRDFRKRLRQQWKIGVANPDGRDVMDDSTMIWNTVAQDFIARRSAVIGVAEVSNWAVTIPAGGSILDLGCGHGFPVASALVKLGFNVYGIDASIEMSQEFQSRLPTAHIRCEAVEQSNYFDRQFDAAIAIGLMFLLSEPSQRQLIHRVAAALHPGGALLFTAPAQAVSWPDNLTGQQSLSLGREAYRALLQEAGFELATEFADEGGNHYYSATKRVA